MNKLTFDKKQISTTCAGLLFAALIPLNNAYADTLLVNGSFELPTGISYTILPGNSAAITGWTTILSGVEWFNATGYGGAADGVMVVDLANYVYTGGGIQQSFATQVGHTYSLNFSLGTTAGSGRDGTAHIDVSVAGITTGFDVVNYASTLAWTNYNFNFTAIDTTTTLSFMNNQNPYLHFADLDGVGVSTVPVPAAAWLFGSGLMGLFGMARRAKA